jgi:hypothetical protein
MTGIVAGIDRPRRQTHGAAIAAGVVAGDDRGPRPGEERCGGSHLLRGPGPPCARPPTGTEPVVWFQASALSRAY